MRIEEKLRCILLDASLKPQFQIWDTLIIQNGLLVILDLHIGERKIMKKQKYSKDRTVFNFSKYTAIK